MDFNLVHDGNYAVQSFEVVREEVRDADRLDEPFALELLEGVPGLGEAFAPLGVFRVAARPVDEKEVWGGGRKPDLLIHGAQAV